MLKSAGRSYALPRRCGGPVDYSWLIFAGLIGFVFFQEVPTVGAIAGALLIAAGGIVLALLNPAPKVAQDRGARANV